MKTINANDLHAKDMADPVYRDAYEKLENEFEQINAVIRARANVRANSPNRQKPKLA